MKQGNIINYIKVSFSDLPKQDYALAKFLFTSLQVGQYADVRPNNIDEFRRYILLLSENNYFYIVNENEYNVTVCNSGRKSKHICEGLIYNVSKWKKNCVQDEDKHLTLPISNMQY